MTDFGDRFQEFEGALVQAHRWDKDANPNLRVYFIQESGMGAIKIGKSKCPRERAQELGWATPHTITLLATIEGGRGVEATLHLIFEHAHVRGEWFRPVPELLRYIKEKGEPPEVTAQREREELFEKCRSTKVLA